MEKIYIILLNFNGYKDTIECIKSIRKKEKKIDYEIIVVDNKSTDNSIEELSKLRDIYLIESNENKGFSYGNNLGIKYALNKGAKYILLLNNDTVIDENSISILKEEMDKHKKLGIISSRIMYYDFPDRINCDGGYINWLRGTAVIENKGNLYKKCEKNFKYTEFVTGCCMLIKREVLETIGYLPEEYFMYYEDVDYCVKVREYGFKIGVCYDSVIYHKESASSGGNENSFAIKWNTRNRMIFIKKYKCKGILTKTFFYTTRIIVGLKYLIKGESSKAIALYNGIKEGKNICNEWKNKK